MPPPARKAADGDTVLAKAQLHQAVARAAIDGAMALAYTDPQIFNSPETSMAEPDMKLDARNLNCPLPVLKLKKAMADLRKGGTIEVLATDPGADADFEAFCTSTGNSLLERGESDGVYRFVIRRMA